MKVLLDRDREIREAHERYKEFVEDRAKRAAYESREKAIRDYEAGLAAAREERAQAIAREMKANAVPVAEITRYTGLSAEEIQAL
jgi:predicted transposase/invertase (TIGR01784 family)